MVKHYVGARYVPKFASPVEWAADTSYEALTIVTFNNASYASKIQVPPTVGNPAKNPKYWALTGNYNAQVEQYRQETETANNILQGNINSEAATRASADSNLQSQINQIVAPSGEAPSVAEVQNARIGVDGVTYDTLGTAIRSQVGELKGDLVELSKSVDASAEQLNTALATKADAIISSASGAIASFPDGAESTAKKLVVSIEPVQEGTGDPSPDNVRPITGWTGAKVTVSPTTDEADGQTYSITFPSEAGTVYGGTLDVTTGELVVDRTMVAVKDMAWSRTTSYGNPVFYVNQNGKALTYQKGACSFLRDIGRAGMMSALNFADYAENGDFALGSNNAQIFVRYDDITDVSTFKTQFGDETFVYPLATPITYHLTPNEIRTLLGQNNIWADTGDVSVKYNADTKLYIDKKFTELQALILEN